MPRTRRKMFEECLNVKQWICFDFLNTKLLIERISSIEISVRFDLSRVRMSHAILISVCNQVTRSWTFFIYFNIQFSSIRYLFAHALLSYPLFAVFYFRVNITEENENLLICSSQTQNVAISSLLKIYKTLQELNEMKLCTATLNEKTIFAWH